MLFFKLNNGTQINGQRMKPVHKMVLSAMFVAMGVSLSTLYIPFGAAKCFPVQHLINVISAVVLGPFYAVANAFLISLIRNMLGLGSLLAFPGSMIGALLAALTYRWFRHYRFACLGELIGTGLIGGIIAAPFAIFLMGKEVGLFFFVIPFVLSSLSGSLIALILLETTAIMKFLRSKRLS